MSDNPLSGTVSLNTDNYKAGVAELNRQVRVIESGFKASAAALGDWSNTIDGMQQRIKALTAELGPQQQKVDGLSRVYNELASTGKTSARELAELQIKINKETETLNKMQSELNQSKIALDGMGKESTATGQEVEQLAKKEETASIATDKLASKSGGLGVALKTAGAAVAGLAVGVVGIGAGITKMVLGTASTADALDEMSQKTGISTDRLQELQYTSTKLGTDFGTVTDSMARLVRSMDAGTKAGSPAAQAFAELGIGVTDANGKLRDSKVVWEEAIAALGKIPDETERDAVSMALFGKSAQELNPLILAGAAGIAELSDEAHKMGAVMSGEDITAMADFNGQLDGLKMGLQGTVAQVSMAFLPAFAKIATQGGGYLKTFAGIVKSSNGDMSKMTSGVAGLVKTIVTDIAGQAPQMLQGGLSIIQGIVTAMVASLPTLLPAVVAMMTTLVTFLIANIPLLLTAAVQILVGLANGLTTALPQLIPAIVMIIPQIITTLVENLPLLITAALQLIIALATGLVNALPSLIAEVPKIVTTIMETLITVAPQLLTTAFELIKTLVKGLVDNLPAIGTAAGQVVETVVTGVGRLASSIFDVGKNIVMGVWNGISSMASYFSDQVSGFFNGIVDGVKRTLGIQSPSKVFGGIGQNMALGLGQGFTGQFAGIERQINSMVAGMDLGGVTVGAGDGAGYASQTNNRVNVAITNYGMDPARAGSASERGVRRALRSKGG
jgi:phage-related protein